MDKVEEVIIGKLKEMTGREDITAQTSLTEDLALTSVNAMKLSFDVENELGCKEIPQETYFSVETVGDLAAAVRELL